ncbi:MAG: FtsL-like putative cell division protein [Bacteroidetes bacterium]|nr:FtsL-like putative cell division protein [Bacteroidota bacterium]
MTETTAPITDNQVAKSPSKKGVANLFQTKWINENMLFFLYLAALTIGYIAYGHWTDRTLRKISNTKKEIEILEYKYRATVIEASKVNQQSEIIKAVESSGLSVSDASPIIIKK